MASRLFGNSRLSRLRGLIRSHYGLLADSTAQQQAAPAEGLLGSLSARHARGFATATEPPPSRGGPVSYTSLALTFATGAGLLAYYQHLRKEKLKEAAMRTETAGTAAIGGPFALIDTKGDAFTDKDLLGKWALLYFGFTFCPDICPDELEKMAAAVQQIDKEVGEGKVQPVFISIDPARDGAEQVGKYVREFHPRLVGLTGTEEQVKQAARAFRVYYMKTNEGEDYLVDHSIIMYLLNPDGNFVTFYGKNYDADQLARGVMGHVRKWDAAGKGYGKQPEQQQPEQQRPEQQPENGSEKQAEKQ